MSPRPAHSPMFPALVGGALMAAYLLLRPYGDAAGTTSAQAADAFASQLWVVSHVCGVLALAAYALVVHRLTGHDGGWSARVARSTAALGAVLVGPYYGAETFGLHVLGTHAAAGSPELLFLVAAIREDGAAMTMFVAGLLALAVSGVALGLSWRGNGWAVWPLATLVVLFTPQYFVPPAGRMAYGVLYLAACVLLAWVVARRTTTAPREYAALTQT